MDSHSVVRNDTERFHVVFTQFAPMITSNKTIVRCQNWDNDTEILKIQNISIITKMLHIFLFHYCLVVFDGVDIPEFVSPFIN